MKVDVLIIGAGAAGLMCAAVAGARGRQVLVVDHASKVGRKILMSGGGRCNFTNIGAGPANYLSANAHFAKSALARYTPADFIALVEKHGIAYHEKELGQLFCNESSKQIVRMLLDECAAAGVTVEAGCGVHNVRRSAKNLRADKCRRNRWWWPAAACPSPAWAPLALVTNWRVNSAMRYCRYAPDWCH
jgi:predicted Rossmann fold flavoprotein